jgi:hypothetical protein
LCVSVCGVFRAVTAKSTVMWDVNTDVSLSQVCRRFGVTYCQHLQFLNVTPKPVSSRHSACLSGLLIDPRNGGDRFFRNVHKLPDYTTSHLRREYFFVIVLVIQTSRRFADVYCTCLTLS